MWRSVFAVPCELVDSRLKLCGEAQLKVLLALLRYNGGLDENALSSLTGLSVPAVRDSLEALAALGLFAGEGEREEAPAPPPAAPPQSIPQIQTERGKLTREEINMMADEDETVSFLLQEAQQVLGKTLGFAATETIVSLYAHYGMAPDVILMVLQYCKGIDKANMPYIEKVAASWVENGITTHEAAEREIMRLNERHSAEGRIKSAFGIRDRSLTQYESKYIPVWLEEYGFDIPLIQLAYERCVVATGKLSFSYINKILTSWHKEGISTPKAALKAIKDYSAQRGETRRGDAQTASTSYDMAEIEKMLDKVTF
jgi:DnaD/phage-associated family protein